MVVRHCRSINKGIRCGESVHLMPAIEEGIIMIEIVCLGSVAPVNMPLTDNISINVRISFSGRIMNFNGVGFACDQLRQLHRS